MKVASIRVGKRRRNTIGLYIYIEKGRLQVWVDNSSQINIISPKVVDRLDLPYHDKERPLEIIMVDGIMTNYGDGLIYLETLELPIVIEGRQFYTSFNITLVGLTDIILGQLQLRAVKPQFDYEKEELIQLDSLKMKVNIKEKLIYEVIIEVLKIITKEIP